MSRAATTTTYNPHLLPRADLVASFVARRSLLDELVDDLCRGGHQHHLLVGSRGSGKTTLLLRLAVAIEEDKKLERSAIPLRFPEEQYNVARPSDFWLNCVDALADALDARGDHAGRRKLEASVEAIEQLPEDERSPAALEALTGWAKRTDKLLVLLVDNLGLILERLRDSQWGLREALSQDNRLVLIGATSTFLEESTAYESPLYDFFNVHELGQLSEEDARAVVAQLARLTGSTEVEAVLENDPGRFKALYVLTGGMPRMLALLAGVLAQDSGPAESDLEQMLDQLTPYYKARFDELPAQGQLVVNAVALHWYPITAAECAERTRLDVNLVSAQLNRLVKLGLLGKVSLPGGSKLGFQLVERFFNVWYLMRASRRARQRLVWFVEFLRMFYSEEELSRRAQAVLDRAPGSASSTHVLALAAAVPDAALRRRLELRAATMLVEEIRPEAIRELLDLGGADAHLSPVLDRARTLKELRARLAREPELSDIGPEILRSPILSLSTKISVVGELAREGPKTAAVRRNLERATRAFSLLGDRLFAAIARGEVPSVPDITTSDEVAALMGLAEHPFIAATMLLAYVAGYQSFVGDDRGRVDDAYRRSADACSRLHDVIVRSLLDLNFSSAVLGSAAGFVELGKWEVARDYARKVFRRFVVSPETTTWDQTIWFFRTCVQRGRTNEAAELVEELGLNDRWLPLYEALRAVGSDRLDRLAPEVRMPTAELLEILQRTDPDVAPASKAPASTAPASKAPASKAPKRSAKKAQPRKRARAK